MLGYGASDHAPVDEDGGDRCFIKRSNAFWPQLDHVASYGVRRADQLAQSYAPIGVREGPQAADPTFERQEGASVIVALGMEQTHRDLQDALIEPPVGGSSVLPQLLQRLVALEELTLVELFDRVAQL